MPFRFEHGRPEAVKRETGEEAIHYHAIVSLPFLEKPEVFGLFMPVNSKLTEEEIQAKLMEQFKGLLEENPALKMKIMMAVASEQDYLHTHIHQMKEATRLSEERLAALQEFENNHG